MSFPIFLYISATLLNFYFYVNVSSIDSVLKLLVSTSLTESTVHLITNLCLFAGFMVAPIGALLSDKVGLGRFQVLRSIVLVATLLSAAGAIVSASDRQEKIFISFCVPFACVLNGLTPPLMTSLIDQAQESVDSSIFWLFTQVGSFVGILLYGQGSFDFDASPVVVFAVLFSATLIIFLLLQFQFSCTKKRQKEQKRASEGESSPLQEAAPISFLELVQLFFTLSPVIVFYSVFFLIFSQFEQTAEQLTSMRIGPLQLEATSVAALQPACEIVLIILQSLVKKALGYPPSYALNRFWTVIFMLLGVFCAFLSCCYSILLEEIIPPTRQAPFLVVIFQYIFMSLGEIFFVINALRFAAFTHPAAESVTQSMIFVLVGLGNALLIFLQFLSSTVLSNSRKSLYLLCATMLLSVFFILILLMRKTLFTNSRRQLAYQILN